MKRKKGFFSELKKSTIITMVSCGSFIVAMFFALLFFVRFPISPPEKMTASLGRRSTYGLDTSYSATQTTTTTTNTTTTLSQTTSKATTRTDFVITVTMGKGFSHDEWSYTYIPELEDAMTGTGLPSGSMTTTTTTARDDDDDDDYYDDDYYYNNYSY